VVFQGGFFVGVADLLLGCFWVDGEGGVVVLCCGGGVSMCRFWELGVDILIVGGWFVEWLLGGWVEVGLFRWEGRRM
jgi:hypothetical protein